MTSLWRNRFGDLALRINGRTVAWGRDVADLQLLGGRMA